MKQIRLTILLLALAILLAGCNGAGDPVRYDIPGGVSNLDPQFATDPAARMIISNTFEGLFSQMPDGSIQPCLAQSQEVSSDGLTYTFHLRTDAVWTGGGKQYDGTPVTAHDFVFAFRRMFNSQAASPFAGSFSCLKNADAILAGTLTADQLGVRAIDDYTLEITLDRPNVLLPELLSASYAMPCNEAFFRSTRARYGFDLDSLIFNGPFYISVWNNEKRIALRPNPQYVSDEPVLSPGVDLYTSAAQDGAGDPVARFLSGETDACKVGFESLPAVAAMGGDIEAFEDTVWVLVFNTRAEPFSNASVRRAYAHSLNRALFEGQLPQNLRAASTLIPPAVRMGGEAFRAYAGEDGPIAYSTELARQYYTAGTDELGVSQIDPGEILVCETNNQKMLAGYVQQGLQRSFGLFSGLTVLPQDEVLARVNAGDFSAAILPLTADCPMFMENPPNEVTPSGTPTIVATRMPMIIEPLILRACSAPITTSPTSATSADATSPCSSGSPHLEKSISATSVELFETTSPAFFSPISARNRPIPALIAPRTHGGIARTHASRKPIAVITINRIPEIKTIASACP